MDVPTARLLLTENVIPKWLSSGSCNIDVIDTNYFILPQVVEDNRKNMGANRNKWTRILQQKTSWKSNLIGAESFQGTLYKHSKECYTLFTCGKQREKI